MAISKLLTKKNKKDFIIFLVIMTGITVYVGSVQKEEIEKAKLIHCENINADITRPIERYCDKVISLSGSQLIFETKSGATEEYSVMEIEGKQIYLFERMILEEGK